MALRCATPARTSSGREARAELENLEVLRLDQRLERGEIDHARAGGAMVAAGELDVVDVEAASRSRERFQVHRVADEAEVLLDLGVAGVVPVDHGGLAELEEEEREVVFEGDLLQGLAVLDAELEAAAFGLRDQPVAPRRRAA